MTQNGTVVVSGGGSGIGRAVVHRLAQDKRHVTVVGRRREPLQAVVDEVGSGDAVAADVGTEDGAAAVADHLRAAGRTCEGVVAAAGGISPSSGTGLAAIRTNWQESFESNVLTAVLLVEGLREQFADDVRLVLLSSVAALRGSGGGPYGAMKAALHAWAFDLAAGLAPGGGTANVIAPGFVPDTEFWADRLPGDARERRAAGIPLGREGTPGEVASLIAWLLGPDGGWVTAQVLSPNGGVVLGR